MGSTRDLKQLTQEIHACDSCPRLRQHCLATAREKRRSTRDEEYWGKPISPFGIAGARLFIMGLAPAAHGANRTGRIFTGDRSGDWLFRALHRAGFANQWQARSRDDGLELFDTVISCVVKCAPPDNKPSPAELRRCMGRFASHEMTLFSQARVYVALGGIAWNGLWQLLEQGSPRPPFGHGTEVRLTRLPGWTEDRYLLGSYHPSQQNTFTGRLTEPMFDAVFARARQLLNG
jgi:uracil-DNA glycosylase